MKKTPSFKVSDLIRNLKTGNTYVVLHVTEGFATLVAPLNDTSELPQTLTLFPRQYDYFIKDSNAVLKNGNYQRDTIEL